MKEGTHGLKAHQAIRRAIGLGVSTHNQVQRCIPCPRDSTDRNESQWHGYWIVTFTPKRYGELATVAEVNQGRSNVGVWGSSVVHNPRGASQPWDEG